MFTPPDQDSIMCYQLPGAITPDGLPIRGGLDINATDYEFVGRICPRPRADEPGALPAPRVDEDWPEAEDVYDVAI